MIIVLFLGIGLFSYPFVSDAVNSYFDQQLVQYYQQKANNENEEAVAKLKEKQDKQNAELAKDGNNPGVAVFNDAVSNEQQKKIKKEQSYLKQHTIATLTIPKSKLVYPFLIRQTNCFYKTVFPCLKVQVSLLVVQVLTASCQLIEDYQKLNYLRTYLN